MSDVIERMLTIYDGSSEEMISMFRFPRFELKAFIQQFDVDPKADPEMFNRYAIGPDDTSFVLKHLDEELEFDFQQKAYFIEAVENDLS